LLKATRTVSTPSALGSMPLAPRTVRLACGFRTTAVTTGGGPAELAAPGVPPATVLAAQLATSLP